MASEFIWEKKKYLYFGQSLLIFLFQLSGIDCVSWNCTRLSFTHTVWTLLRILMYVCWNTLINHIAKQIVAGEVTLYFSNIFAVFLPVLGPLCFFRPLQLQEVINYEFTKITYPHICLQKIINTKIYPSSLFWIWRSYIPLFSAL